MMRTLTMPSLLALLALGTAGAAAAQESSAPPGYERDVPEKLLAEVKVGEDSSRVLALAQVPGGVVEAVELIREHGKVTWVWDIKVAGKRGITEVSVSALDGSVAAADEP